MKAFEINERDIYAGDTLEEAIEAAMADSGNPREETFEDGYGDEASLTMKVHEEDGDTTVGEILASMSKPGLVCTTEY